MDSRISDNEDDMDVDLAPALKRFKVLSQYLLSFRLFTHCAFALV